MAFEMMTSGILSAILAKARRHVRVRTQVGTAL